MKDRKTKKNLWEKATMNASNAGRTLIEQAFTLYYCLIDEDTPAWVKTAILGALIYFINPVDAIPDFIAGVGYVDDASVMAGAFIAVSAHIKPEHKERAKKQADTIFGDTSNGEAFE